MGTSAAAQRPEGGRCSSRGRETLAGRARGRLAYALRTTLPGESREGLDLLVEEDRRLAQSGLVSLAAEDGTMTYRHASLPAIRWAVGVKTSPAQGSAGTTT